MHSLFPIVLAAATTLPSVFAHYNFEALIVNGNATSPYEFVRQTTNSNSPITDVTSDDFICNQGGLDADIMAKTQTHTVFPGDEVGFTVNVEIGHPGPLAVYMSKAPDGTEASAYKGDGDWFKVYELTTSSITDAGLQWATYVNNAGIHNFTFQLPEDLPAGDYLIRAEHTALHGASTFGGAQFYIGCAQVAVTGSGAGSPSPTVKIPGVYDGNEPGILINIYWPIPTNYTAPGPATWPNACEDHTANLDGQTSDGDCTGSNASDVDSGSSPVSSQSASSSNATASPNSETAVPTQITSADVTTPTVPAATLVPTSFVNSTVPTVTSASALPANTESSCSARQRRRSHKH